MIKAILDTDIGTDVDDALALALAVNSPELEILAVTSVTTDARLRARIARKLLSMLGHDEIPVAVGHDHTLDGKPRRIGGLDGFGFIENESEGLPLREEHGVDLIIRILKTTHEKVTILAIGPLTNIADALRREPSIKSNIERLVIMGGSINPRAVLRQEGWVKFPAFFKASLEYNMNADPTASALILKSGIPILLVPAEITFRTWLTGSERAQLAQSPLPIAPLLNRMCDEWVARLRAAIAKLPVNQQAAQVYLHDPLTVAVAFRRDFVTVKKFHLAPGRRMGIFRTLPLENQPPNAEVVTDIDLKAWKRLFAERVFRVTLP